MVGSVRVAMDSLELVSSTSSIEVWGEIARERKPPEEIQEVLVSLSYLPSAERLTVLMMKARNLFPQQVGYTSCIQLRLCFLKNALESLRICFSLV